MQVKELRKSIKNIPDHYQVVLQVSSTGNGEDSEYVFKDLYEHQIVFLAYLTSEPAPIEIDGVELIRPISITRIKAGKGLSIDNFEVDDPEPEQLSEIVDGAVTSAPYIRPDEKEGD